MITFSYTFKITGVERVAYFYLLQALSTLTGARYRGLAPTGREMIPQTIDTIVVIRRSISAGHVILSAYF